MKTLLIAFLVTVSANSFAKNCHDQVESYYQELNYERNYDDEGISHQPVEIEEARKDWENLDFDAAELENFAIYYGYSSAWGGYGVDALIYEKATCQVVAIEEVYAE